MPAKFPLGKRFRVTGMQTRPRMKSAVVTLDVAALSGLHRAPWMADVAQLVERQVVVLDVVGSSPIVRPI